MTDQDKCPHCGMSKKVRNPSGFCDHLYYPENCKVCRDREVFDSFTTKKYIDIPTSAIIRNDFKDWEKWSNGKKPAAGWMSISISVLILRCCLAILDRLEEKR